MTLRTEGAPVRVCGAEGSGAPVRTFDIYEGGRRYFMNASAEDVIRALWARWHARQRVFAGEAFEIPARLRFEIDGLTIVERDPTAVNERAEP